MGDAGDEWRRLAKAIRAEGLSNPVASRHLGQLYALAIAEAPGMLSSFHRIDDVEKVDLAAELVTGRARAIVDADNPHGYFRVALRNRAIDLVRATGRLDHADEDPPAPTADLAVVPDLDELIDRRHAFESCGDRDQQILRAFGLGETPEDIGRIFGMSRDGVYQIVSRFRRKHQP